MTKPKADHTLTAVCEVWTHPLGWELRLEIDGHGLQLSSVVRSARELQHTADHWHAAMIEKGWSWASARGPLTEQLAPTVHRAHNWLTAVHRNVRCRPSDQIRNHCGVYGE